MLILAGENPSDLKARMIAMAKAFNLPLDQLPYVLPGGFPMTEEGADALKREIAGLGVPLALIIGDTASSFFPGDDENSMSRPAATPAPSAPSPSARANPPSWCCRIRSRAPTAAISCRAAAAPSSTNSTATFALWSASQGEVTEMHWCGKIRGPDFSPFGYRLRSVPTGLTDEKGRPEITIIAEPGVPPAVLRFYTVRPPISG